MVFGANVSRAWLFAVRVANSTALHPDILTQLVKLGVDAATGRPAYFFWSGAIGGWIIALVAWTVTASHWTIGPLAVIYPLTFLVGARRFAYGIASSSEILSAVEFGSIPIQTYLQWLAPTTLGNVCGGMVIVSLFNCGQVGAT